MIVCANALSARAAGHASVKAILSSAERLVIPSIVLGEYCSGIRQSRCRDRSEDLLAWTPPSTEIAAFDSATADFHAAIRQELKNSGRPIPANDTWVAALARQHATAVLSNDGHFDFVDGIRPISF